MKTINDSDVNIQNELDVDQYIKYLEKDISDYVSHKSRNVLGQQYIQAIRDSLKKDAPFIWEGYFCYLLYLSYTDGLTEKVDTLHRQVARNFASTTGAMYNIFHGNVLTLAALTGMEVPLVSLNKRIEYHNPKIHNLTNVAMDVVETIANYYVSQFNKREYFKFKIDWLTTGRGVLWLSNKDLVDGSQSFRLEHVFWNDFACDGIRTWDTVTWVARRHVLTTKGMSLLLGKEKYIKMIKNESLTPFRESEGSLQADADMMLPWFNVKQQNYFIVWEVYDRFKKYHLFICDEYEDKILKLSKSEYFPTVEPLLALPNGIDGMEPRSEFFIYGAQAGLITEMMQRCRAVVRTIQCRDFTSKMFESLANGLNGKDTTTPHKDGDIYVYNGAQLNASPIQSVDNEGKIKVLGVLGEQVERNKVDINETTGISEAMKNKDVPMGETATATNQRTTYGETRLRSHETLSSGYMIELYKSLVKNVTRTISVQKVKDYTGYDLMSNEELQQQVQELEMQEMDLQQQLEMIPQQQDDGSGQLAQMYQQAMETLDQMEARKADLINNTITNEDVLECVKHFNLNNFICDVHITDVSFTDQTQKAQERMEVLLGLDKFMEAALPKMTQYPALCGLYKSMLTTTFDEFRIGKKQRGDIQKSLDSLVDMINQKAQNPTPDYRLVQAQAKDKEADAKVQGTQAKTEIDQFKAELDAQRLQAETELKQKELELKYMEENSQNPNKEIDTELAKLRAEMVKLQMKHELEMQKMKLKETIEYQKHAEKLFRDKEKTNEQITAEINRYKDQMKADKEKFDHEMLLKEMESVIKAHSQAGTVI
jgi:hypothetical protein